MSYKKINLEYITPPDKEKIEINQSINNIVKEINNKKFDEIPQSNEYPNNVEPDIKKTKKIEITPIEKIEIDEKKIDFFLQNLLPYFGTEQYQKSLYLYQKYEKDPMKLINSLDTLSAGRSIFNSIVDLRYLTPKEIIMLYGSDFASIQLFRGITIKKKVDGPVSNITNEYTGNIDLNFGKNQEVNPVEEIISSIKKKLIKLLTGDPNVDISKLKSTNDNKINLYPEIITRFPKKEKEIDLSFVNEKNKTKNDNAIKNRSIKTSKGNWQVGSIYVIPITEGTGLETFYIPFEFNPTITETGMAARYQAQEVISRIGNLYTFLGVNSNAYTLTTTYMALHDPNNYNTKQNNSWMTEATMENIQAIELAYRSLVLPTFPDENNNNAEGYKYVKPPIIRIIMGDGEKSSGIFSNILTYQNPKVFSNKLKSINNVNDRLYKNFIVTSVVINKNLEAQPLYTSEDGAILDTFGFEVTLNMTEITPSYMDQIPDFKSYYDAYTKVYNSNTQG